MKSKVNIQLRYSDTDQMGVIYHANYLSFFEQGRTKLLKDYGINYYDIEASGIIFPVHDIKITYQKAITIDEEITVITNIKKMTDVKIVFNHVIVNDEGIKKAKGESTIVAVDKKTFKIIKMSKRLQNVYRIKEELLDE